MVRLTKGCLCIVLAALLAAPAWAQQAGGLQVTVTAGDGAVNDITAGTAVEPAVEVRGPGGQPLAGAAVEFVAPLAGPSVTFYGASSKQTMTTDEEGRAQVATALPNTNQGEFTIQVTAEAEGLQGAAQISQTNANPQPPLPVEQKKHWGWKVWTAIGAAAIVGVVAAVIRD